MQRAKAQQRALMHAAPSNVHHMSTRQKAQSLRPLQKRGQELLLHPSESSSSSSSSSSPAKGEQDEQEVQEVPVEHLLQKNQHP